MGHCLGDCFGGIGIRLKMRVVFKGSEREKGKSAIAELEQTDSRCDGDVLYLLVTTSASSSAKMVAMVGDQ